MWSIALETLFTTLRLLAPATLLTLFWGHHSLFYKFLHHFDRAFKSAPQQSSSHADVALKWLNEVCAKRVKSLNALWSDGSILCEALDSVVPGSCPGHDTKTISISHAQKLAEKLLGVSSIFTEEELEGTKLLTPKQEWRLANYILEIRDAIACTSPPISKPGSPRCPRDIQAYTLDYVARGMGLVTAEIGMRAIFYIYPTAQQGIEPGDISVQIRGPEQCYGSILAPALYGKGHLSKTYFGSSKLFPNQTDASLMLSSTYLQTYGGSSVERHYFIPKIKHEISIDLSIRHDHVRIYYTPSKAGKYEISLISKSCNVVGSPFTVTVPESRPERRNSVEMNDEFEFSKEREKNARKVVYRIVDFVTEKMLLTDDGKLEKISEEEVDLLIKGPPQLQGISVCEKTEIDYEPNFIKSLEPLQEQDAKFKNIALKIQSMIRVINILKNKPSKVNLDNQIIKFNNIAEIPDLVNFIKPRENIISEEHEYYSYEENSSVNNGKNLFGNYNTVESHDEVTSITDNTDFLNIISEIKTLITEDTTYATENTCCTENEAHTAGPAIVISNDDYEPILDWDEEEHETVLQADRPKTPVLKILETFSDIEESTCRYASEVPHCSNSKLKAVFKIGEPVTNLPTMKSPTPEPDMDSILLASNLEEALRQYDLSIRKLQSHNSGSSDESNSSPFTTPLPPLIFDKMSDLEILNFYEQPLSDSQLSPDRFSSLDNPYDDACDTQDGKAIHHNECNNNNIYQDFSSNTHENYHGKKYNDTWDSAYISIDDANRSPDSVNKIETNQNDGFSTVKDVDSERFETPQVAKINVNEKRNLKSAKTSCEIFSNAEHKKEHDFNVEIEMYANISQDLFSRSVQSTPTFDSIQEEDDHNFCIKRFGDPSFVDLNNFDEHNHALVNIRKTSTAENKNYKICPQLSEESSNLERVKENIYSDIYQNKAGDENVYKCTETACFVNSSSGLDVERQIEGESNLQELKLSVAQAPYSECLQESYVHQTTEKNNVTNDICTEVNISFSPNACDENIIEDMEPLITMDDDFIRIEKNYKLKADSKSNKRISNNLKVKDFLKNLGNDFSGNHTEDSVEKHNSEDIIEKNLVAKWKKYWNEKFEKNAEDNQGIKTIQKTYEKNSFKSKSHPNVNIIENEQNNKNQNNEINKIAHQVDVKNIMQSRIINVSSCNNLSDNTIDEEELKIFESSPKRYFVRASSRENLTNRINTLYKIADESSSSPGHKKSETVNQVHKSQISNEIETQPDRNLSFALKECRKQINVNQPDNDHTTNKEISQKNYLMTQEELITNNALESSSLTTMQSPFQSGNQISKTNQLQSTHSNKISPESCIKSTTQNIPDILCLSDTIKSTLNNDMTHKNVLEESETTGVNKMLTRYTPETLHPPKAEIVLTDVITNEINDFNDENSKDKLSARFSVLETIACFEKIAADPYTAVTIKKSNELKDDANHVANIAIKNPRTNGHHQQRDTEPSEAGEEKCAATDDTIRRKDVTGDKDDIATPLGKPNYLPEERATEAVYKRQFLKAKQFFETLAAPPKEDQPKRGGGSKMNECQQLLHGIANQNGDSHANDAQRRVDNSTDVSAARRRKMVKALSAPASDTECDTGEWKTSRLTKISERFHVDDLFNDVAGDGALRRSGSLRGIPHKNAVLASFRSMDSVNKLSMTSYDHTLSQLADFAKKNGVINSQTYLSEYPYLPTTDPSKYRSRLDAAASGMISRRELLKRNEKIRRYSIPDEWKINFISNV